MRTCILGVVGQSGKAALNLASGISPFDAPTEQDMNSLHLIRFKYVKIQEENFAWESKAKYPNFVFHATS